MQSNIYIPPFLSLAAVCVMISQIHTWKSCIWFNTQTLAEFAQPSESHSYPEMDPSNAP